MVHVQIHVYTYTQDRLIRSPLPWQHRKRDETHARGAPRFTRGLARMAFLSSLGKASSMISSVKNGGRTTKALDLKAKMAPKSASDTPGN
eukprot:3784947-Lingulodinium_polyedra.AAC.1